ncbi:hypothetical protein LMH87_005087 [Akanthomyces muscarius]|uniref:F-box domain-containing protein n=1 Tax=Akanthomyces muscarius TaxID=2231603 RepID=A0A9W8QNG5_AKAMU|nr:hypothetical protein LMH87_005087 [Akanthomyces muscarius]KAJ4163352.1 hypothetical protein LMH87_005087 [Akanthomyces muscarius]
MAPKLCALPPELIRLILLACAPEDILAIISASPRWFQVYIISPGRYMLNATKSQVPALLWPEFCAVYCAAKSFRPFKQGSLLDSQRREVQDFFNRVFEDPRSFESAIGPHNAKEAYLLYCKVDYFIRGFAIKASKEASFLQQNSTDSITDVSVCPYDLTLQGPVERAYSVHITSQIEDAYDDPMTFDSYEQFNLSDTEVLRLYRAFLWFEMCCKLCRPALARQDLAVYTYEEQYVYFIHRFEPWEIEELAAVHQYLSEIVATVLEGTDKEFEAEVQRLVGKERILGLHFEKMAERKPNLSRYRATMSDPALYLFTDFFMSNTTTATRMMACAGLRHIYDLARSAKDVQLELIRRTHSVAFSQGLFNLFRVPQPRFARFLVLESDFRDGDDVIPEDPTQPSMGYTKYWPSIWNEYLRVYDQSSPHRAADFAFWDAERIHGTLLREALKEAGRMCPEFVKRRYGTKRRQSSQTKFELSVLSPESVDRIVEKFGAYDILQDRRQ